ncbi:Coiled-coil domain-containing protein [Toxocara canis]|uniref:Coiled-coil domain-containing protein n=1 Tax=Toxocara canis TaxID=6265 RepID=A0A0B2VEE2_TOXCA|nr:Coiled-coil domain-containing protein [Toxocara canis]
MLFPCHFKPPFPNPSPLFRMRSFEEDVEEVRKLVLNTNRKLRMAEVESFTNSLTKIGRTAAKLKTHFPSIQRELEVRIKSHMEKVVREEKFIKEESVQIDQCLRRCKTLANMMVTMKKLAMVQDPTVNSNYRMPPPNEMLPKPQNVMNVPAVIQNESPTMNPPTGPVNSENVPPVPPSPLNYEGPSTSEKKEDTHVLDTILDELTGMPQRETKSLSPSNVRNDGTPRNGPPKPPERHSKDDVRNRFTPSQVQELQRRAVMDSIAPAHSSSAPAALLGHVANNDRFQKPPAPISTTDALGVSDPSTHGTSSNDPVHESLF